MASAVVPPTAIRAFRDAAAFERWLTRHHATEREIYIRIFKKASDVATVTYAQALDVALCWGWIDGIRKALDTQSYLQRFTPRTPKSVWSQINREHIARLIKEGRMTAHGSKQVEAAKADGRWQDAYASPSKMTTPEDLLLAIRASKKALAAFEGLNSANRYALAWRIGSLKTVAAREKRIAMFVAMLERGETLHPNGASKKKRAKS